MYTCYPCYGDNKFYFSEQDYHRSYGNLLENKKNSHNFPKREENIIKRMVYSACFQPIKENSARSFSEHEDEWFAEQQQNIYLHPVSSITKASTAEFCKCYFIATYEFVLITFV